MSNIIDYAKAYNFEKIKECVENGEDINQVDDWGQSVFYNFLEKYYTSKDFFSEERYNLFHSDVDDDVYDGFLNNSNDPVPLDIPLENRRNILEKLNWFFENGMDINYRESHKGSKDYGWTPLTVSIGEFDYYMTKYLLEHNANPKIWLDYFEEQDEYNKYETWAFDEMDRFLLDDGFPSKEWLREVIKFTALLAKYINEDYVGVSGLKVNSRKRIVSYRQISKYHY